jgi:phenylalanyl-tRNA synthetase alpha subunit
MATILNFKVSGFLGKILDKMLQTAVSRRYQSAAEVLKDLNQEQKQATTPTVATPAKPVHQSPPATTPLVKTSASKSKSLVDDELAEMRSQFLEAGTSKNENQKSTPQKAPSPNPAQSKSQVDLELEELKSQFLGSPKPKKPPTQT